MTALSDLAHHIDEVAEGAALDVGRVEEDAYRSSVEESPAAMAHYVIDNVGQRRAAAALGLKDARPLKAWAAGGAIKESAGRARLRILYRVTLSVVSAFGPDTAAAFLESTSPYLADRSPIALLATTTPVEDAEVAVVSATRALLEG